MKLFSLLPKRLVHFACNSPHPNPSAGFGGGSETGRNPRFFLVQFVWAAEKGAILFEERNKRTNM